MKKITAIVGAGIVFLALTGCVPYHPDPENTPAAPGRPPIQVFEQPVPEGGTITCIWAQEYQEGGLSCDWVGYHLENSTTTEEGE